MNKAWLTYDSSLRPIGISWGEPICLAIEIDPILAIEFIHGHRQFNHWSIIVKNDVPELVENIRNSTQSNFQKFWNLAKGDDPNTTVSIFTDEKEIRIFSTGLGIIQMHLYATFKNDPAWLIKSWDLSTYNNNEGRITILLDGAKNYSYYVDKII